jgi:uncharacterized RDD family membrane protein YckC
VSQPPDPNGEHAARPDAYPGGPPSQTPPVLVPPAAVPPPPPPPPPYGNYENAGQSGSAPSGAPPGLYYDQASGLNLPVGVELASVGRRIGAFFLAFPLAIVTLGIGYVIWGVIVWARGQTPALQVLGMRCWRPETGRVAGWGWMALREIVGRFIESIIFLIALASFILMAASRERRSLHDLIAGTVVLRDLNKVLATAP